MLRRGQIALFGAALGLFGCGDASSSPPPPEPPPTIEGWAEAPELIGVTYEAGRDDALVHVPAVEGAEDHRVIVLDDDLVVTSDEEGREHVASATIFCAGREQHSAPVEDFPNDVLRTIEVAGLEGPTHVVVEAIDRECPFVGVIGAVHVDVPTAQEVQTQWGSDATFPIRTEAEIVEEHGSLIVNGHGPSGVLARPAAPVVPRVLARAELLLEPTGTDVDPMPSFEDFDDPSDVFTYVGSYSDRGGAHGHELRNGRFSVFTHGTANEVLGDRGVGHSVAFVSRGQLHTYVADRAQEIFGTTMIARTAPYGHDGRFATQREAIVHPGSGPAGGVATFDDADRDAHLAFLGALTGAPPPLPWRDSPSRLGHRPLAETVREP